MIAKWLIYIFLLATGLISLLLYTNHQGLAKTFGSGLLFILLAAIVLIVFHIKKNNIPKKIIYLLFIIGILVPYVFIFRAFFSGSPLVWGDAPYFYQENLAELFQKPLLWDFRNHNFGGSQSDVLWLYFPTFLFGLLYKLFGFMSPLLIRLIFYFPATILAVLGSFLLIKKFTSSKMGIFLGVLLYEFNTYFLGVLDGGQIGVGLAYGFFPLVLFNLVNLLEEFNKKNFFWATLSLTLLTNIDVRIGALAIFTILLVYGMEAIFLRKLNYFFNKLTSLVPLILTVSFLDSYWIIPLILSKNLNQFSAETNLTAGSLVTILNGFFLYSPHFPKNEFGQISALPYQFFLLPIIIISSIILSQNKKIISLWSTLVILIFLVKGSGEPFGRAYEWFINNIPFAIAFRDSSKFFIPIFSISAILLSVSASSIFTHLKKYTLILPVLVFASFFTYLLFLVSPAFSGELTGVLQTKQFDQDYQQIYENLKLDTNFFRTVWFSERPPLGFTAMGKEAVNANLLFKEKPFASMIEGTYDLYFFIHNPNLSDWLKLLGIKYAFFPQNERKKIWSEKELVDRKLFLQFIDSLGFGKLDWSKNFPSYQLKDPNPKIFSQKKALIILGDMSIYEKLNKLSNNFSLSNQGVLFLEDGKLDPEALFNLSKDCCALVLNERKNEDLRFVFLQKYFLDKNVKTDWGKFNDSQYLESKYELLKKGIKTQDLFFGKGIFFSNVRDEKLTYLNQIEKSGNYYLSIRSIVPTGSPGIKLTLKGDQEFIKSGKGFQWNSFGPQYFSAGQNLLSIENMGGFSAVNVVAAIPEEEFNNASKKVKQLEDNFETYDLSKFADEIKLRNELNNLQFEKVSYQEHDPTSYTIYLEKKEPRWIVFSDHFDNGWQLEGNQGFSPLPFYSMINGFFVNKENGNEIRIKYKPQGIDLGLKLSIAGLVLFIISALAILSKKS